MLHFLHWLRSSYLMQFVFIFLALTSFCCCFRGQFHGCPISEGAQIHVSGLLGSRTPNNNNILVRGLGILPSGTFSDGTLTVFLWSSFRPFQEFGFEFELVNPPNVQPEKQISVSVSDLGGLNIPATKALGYVLGTSNIAVDNWEQGPDDTSQVFQF
jgi:hypothetical protein